ncbi:hypothetical protein QOT17_020968 [Balamuthia mandrillaris]
MIWPDKAKFKQATIQQIMLKELRHKILCQFYDDPMGGHFGLMKMYSYRDQQLQETQHKLAKEAHRVDNAQKEKTEKPHGKLEEEFKVGDLVLIHSKSTYAWTRSGALITLCSGSQEVWQMKKPFHLNLYSIQAY